MADIVPPPLSGDTDTIRSFTQTYRSTATALRQAAVELLALSNDQVTVSQAVDEIREKATQAYTATEKVATRYEGAADTYYAYRQALMDAQTKANQARGLIDSNNANAAYWRKRKIQLIATAAVAAPTDPDFPKDLKEATDKVDDFDADYQSAMAQYNQAVEDKATAVAIAIAGLDTAASEAGLNDNFFEGLAGMAQQLYELAQKYLAPLIEKLRDLLELIKSIVDIISLIVTILAIFIPALAPLAAALTLVSLALSVLVLACSLVLFALGKESLGRVVGDLIGVVVGIVTSKLGGSGAAHAAEGVVAGAGQTFSQVAAANGGKLVTVVDALVEVTAKTGTETLIDLGVGTAQHLANTGLDITADQFPNANGQPAGTEGVGQVGGVTWDFNSFTDPKDHVVFAADTALGFIPGYSEVAGFVDNVGGYMSIDGVFELDLSPTSNIYDAVVGS